MLSVDNIFIQGEPIKNVSNFIYHENSTTNVNKDIERRVNLALSFLGRLRKLIW